MDREQVIQWCIDALDRWHEFDMDTHWTLVNGIASRDLAMIYRVIECLRMIQDEDAERLLHAIISERSEHRDEMEEARTFRRTS